MHGMPISSVAPRGGSSCMPPGEKGAVRRTCGDGGSDSSNCGEGSGLSRTIGAGAGVLIVSDEPFFFSSRTVELLSMDALPSGISSSTMVAALLFPLTVLAGDARPLLFVDIESTGFFFAATDFFVGVALTDDTVLFTDSAIDGGRRMDAGLGDLRDSSEGASDVRDVERDAEFDDAAEGTRGRVSVIFPVAAPCGPCVLLLPLDRLDATEVRRESVAVISDCAVLNVVEPSLVADSDDVGRGGREETGRDAVEVGREGPLAGGGRRLWRGAGGVRERSDDATEGASDLGLLLASDGLRDDVLTSDGLLDDVDGEWRDGVTFVMSVLRDGVMLLLSPPMLDRTLLLPTTLDRKGLVSTAEVGLGVSFESGRMSLGVSSSGVGGRLVVV